MLYLSVKLQLFTYIMFSATDSYLSYITGVERTTLDARGLLVRQRRGASERVVLVDERRVFFSPLRDSASPLNSVAPNEKKTSGTQGKKRTRNHSQSLISTSIRICKQNSSSGCENFSGPSRNGPLIQTARQYSFQLS